MSRKNNNKMERNQWKDNKKDNNTLPDDLGEWIQNIVQDAVDSMDFTGLSQNIKNAVNSAKEEMTEQIKKQSFSRGRQKYERKESLKKEQKRDSRIQRPAAERQPKERGWLRKIPGRWSGPICMFTGGSGLAIFGALCLGFGFAGIGYGMTHGILSTATIVLESVFIPLTILSGVLFGAGKTAKKRVKRIEAYAHIWGDNGFVMLDELKKGTGYALKRIKKDIQFLLDKRLIPYARMDENHTCLILTKEAGEQYDAAIQARAEREKQEEEKKMAQFATEEGQTSRKQDGTSKNIEEMSEEEQKLYHLQQTGGQYLGEIRQRKQSINTPAVSEKLDRLELLLSRIFVCMSEYPENLSQADRLLDYYLPSVMKLIRVYEDMEKQPIQSVNIIKTRMEIDESLDTVNQALESMYDDMFQDVAMDISSDIKVLETMLAKDGWSGQEMHSEERTTSSIWE